MKNHITITDWAGNVLYEGHYKRKAVDEVLDANRCKACNDDTRDDCKECDGTGYSGDFEINWADEADERNVYEFVNY